MRAHKHNLLRGLAMVIAIAVLSSCHDDDGGGAALVGAFEDDPVEGLSYVSGSHSGETNANGQFNYGANGDRITFSVGDIEIGSGDTKPLMTPVDLVSDEDPGAVDETNERVTNIARFLQTIDDDDDPSNNIQITQAVRDAAAGNAIEFDQTIAAFQTDAAVLAAVTELTTATSAGERPLVPVSEAQSQLHDTLVEGLAGCYEGTFQGTAGDTTISGTFEFTADDSGAVTGTFTDDSGTISPVSIPMAGEIGSSGAFVLTASGEGFTLTFEGTVSNGEVSGDWVVEQGLTLTSAAGSPRPSGALVIASGTFTGATCTGGGGGGGGSFSFFIGATATSNPDEHPNHFDGAFCTIEIAENGTDLTVECAKKGVLDFLISGTFSDPSFSAMGKGLYAGFTTEIVVTGTKTQDDISSGSMSAGTDGALPDTNGNTVHEPIVVDFDELL